MSLDVEELDDDEFEFDFATDVSEDDTDDDGF
jgi:hypothetical protein